MISFPGYDVVIKNVYDNKNEHVFAYWDSLNDNEKKDLLDQLAKVDFVEFSKLFQLTGKPAEIALDYEPAPYIMLPKNDDEKAKFAEAKKIGIELIKSGKTAAFVVAGGQGSRLGFDGPKGAYKVSPVKNKPLFQLHSEKVLKYCRKYNTTIPFLVMTSNVNHADTVKFFEENNYFGLNKKDVFMFSQNMIPSMDMNGKLILSGKNEIFTNPDGHGGSITALRTSGMIDELNKRGIEYISYFQIDNPLVNIIDPLFIGFHKMTGADISSKALKKAYPDEKVGNFVRFTNGRFGVVEYSDLPETKTFQKNADGSFAYTAGSIGIHIFSRSFVEEITSGGDLSLPFHIARKKIPSYTKDGMKDLDGCKFEKFVFDALPLTAKNNILETLREWEFAPVKNKSGVDSVESSQELMNNLYKSWLSEKKIQIPSMLKTLEISPLFAVESDDIPEDLHIPDSVSVYLE